VEEGADRVVKQVDSRCGYVLTLVEYLEFNINRAAESDFTLVDRRINAGLVMFSGSECRRVLKPKTWAGASHVTLLSE
jgi:hypothetical protein